MTIKRKLAIEYTLATTIVTALCLLALHFVAVRWPDSMHIAIPVTIAIAFIAFVIVGILLARAAIVPWDIVVDEMELVSAEHIEKRLPVKKRMDEIDELCVAFNALLDRLETSFNSQKMFVSNVSHELRTPLATLIGRLDLALQRERTEQYYQYAISDSLHNAWQMSRLIDGLLDLAKADYQKEQVTMERIRLDELLIDVRDTILRSHPDYQVELLFSNEDADDDSAITVMGNIYLLSIAFSNLIENNCKYSTNKTSFVQISFWDTWCTVLFSDNGRGMTEQEQENLFNLFYRGEESKDAEGYGIGMTLVQKIILMHQGEITVRSMKDEGTTFLVQMPHV